MEQKIAKCYLDKQEGKVTGKSKRNCLWGYAMGKGEAGNCYFPLLYGQYYLTF